MRSNLENLPCFRKRKVSDNKRRLDCEDLLSMWKFLDKFPDVNKPVFAAVKAHRVPSFNPSEVDIVCLTQNVFNLKQQLAELKSLVNDIKSNSDSFPTEKQVNALSIENLVNTPISRNMEEKVTATKPMFSDLVRTKQNGEWKTVSRKSKSALEPMRCMIGNDSAIQKIKAIPFSGPKLWHVFVGRLSPETSSDDLLDFLKDWQIDVKECSMLTRTEKWQEKFAAFHVVVDFNSKDAIFDAVQWPLGADIRDWVFKPKVKSNSSASSV